MSELSDLVHDVEVALARAPEKSKSGGRYAVYVPGAVILGTFASKDEARDIATAWSDELDGVVVVDRGIVGEFSNQ
jgi:hypothetical protein